MRTIIAAAALAVALAGPAAADGKIEETPLDYGGLAADPARRTPEPLLPPPELAAAECKVEEFRSRLGITLLVVEGVSNCERGTATIRAYDGEGEGREFLGATATPFFGHVFRGVIEGVTKDPARLRFKFTIRGR